TVFDEIAHHSVDVIAELIAGDLVLAQLSSKTAVRAQGAAQVHLKPFDGSAVAVVDHLALEADIRNLNAGTRVRAAVDIDGDWHVQLGVDVFEPTLELGHQHLRTPASVGEGQLAEFDPTAGHQVSAPMRRSRRQAKGVQARDQLLEFVVGHIEDDELLVGSEPRSVRFRPLHQVGYRGQDGARHSSGDRRYAYRVEPTLQSLHADMVDRVLDGFGRRTVDQRPLEVFGFENFAELLYAPIFN